MKKLDVWQEAIQFADLVYELTGDFSDGYNQIYATAEKQSKMLSGLRRSLSGA